MTLSIFLLICVLTMLGLWLAMYSKGQNRILGFHPKTFIWSTAWLGLGLVALWLINAYTYPSNSERFFSNTDYHLLEHDGFSFPDSLPLVNEDQPAGTLLDNKEGHLTLKTGNRTLLQYREFYEPVYAREEGEYVLQNAATGKKISNGLRLEGPKGFYLNLKIEEDLDADTAAYFFRFDPKGEVVRSKFNLVLHIGYPLVDIVRQTPGWETYPLLGQWLEGATLARATYNQPESDLLYFPSRLQADSIHLGTMAWQGRSKLAVNQDFFIGLGLDRGPVMFLEEGKGFYNLRYRFPTKYRLDSKPENDLFICSNFSDVAQNSVQGGYLFPLLREEENKYHINAGIKYLTSDARTELQLRVIDHLRPGSQKATLVRGGEDFELYTREGKTKWRFRLLNLREDNPIAPWRMRVFVIAFIGLVLFTFFQQGPKNINPFEPAVYVLVFAFLMVRIILQWRMATFPPVEGVSANEWEFLRSGRHFYITVIVTGLWFLLRILILPRTKSRNPGERLRGWLRDKIDWVEGRLEKNNLWIWFRDGFEGDQWYQYAIRYFSVFLPLVIVLGFLRFLGIGQVERFINIALPIGYFFFIEYLNLRYRRPNKQLFYRGINPYSLFNALFTTGYLALSDAGFSIIFLLFLLLWSTVRSVYNATFGKRQSKSNTAWIRSGITLLSLFLVIWKADELIAFVFGQSTWFYWLFILPFAGVTIWYFAGVVLKDLDRSNWKLQLIPVAAVLVLMALASSYGIQKIQDLSYVKYRAAIHWQDLDDIIAEEQFDSGEMGQILRAAQNQWFINNYLYQSDTETSTGPFNLQPHFNKGSSYTTQTTDLVVTRYIISEHSSLVLLFLVLLLLLLPALFTVTFSLGKDQLMAPLGALLLLFAISLFIWLTATNRFVFFGQDFPMISLTSLFTLVFSLGILLFAIHQAQQAKPRNFSISSPVLLPFGILVIYSILLATTQNLFEDDQFDFNVSLDHARSDFDLLDESFTSFQDTFQADVGVDSLLKAFYTSLPDKKISDQPFSQSVFEHLVNDQEIKTNPDELLHLVNRNGRYRLALNRSYFLIQPPQAQRYEWEGNLFAAHEGSGTYLMDLGDRTRRFRIPSTGTTSEFEARISDRRDRINMAAIPPNWTNGEQPVVIVWSEQTEDKSPAFTLSNSRTGGSQYGHRFSYPSIRLESNDYLVFPDEKGNSLRFQYLEEFRYYLAKNIWLNGEQKLFYPLGDKLLWAYYYANAVRTSYSASEARSEDVSVSIDFALTESLSEKVAERFRKNKWDRQRLGVVALNGDGQLRLLLDHREEQIDPNDIREFNEKTREYYLRNNTRLERETFGNINLLKLGKGPGSTLKPIVYAAVTSQYNLGWDRLNVAPISAEILSEVRTDDKQEEIKWYGGKEIDLSWEGINEQDMYGIDAKKYITQSKNLYHSMVIFLGSYTRADLSRRLSWQVLLPPDASKPELNFPLVDYKGQIKRFNPEFWPRTSPNAKTFFGNKGSLLAEGLMDNFDLATFGERSRYRSSYQNIDPFGRSIYSDSRRGYVLYGYPENSYFYQTDRAVEGFFWFIKGMKQVTAGADPIRVTPLKMAEMAGKLYHFNSNYKVSLTDQDPEVKGAGMVEDSSWNGQYLDFVQEYLYGSMRNVVYTGTAGALGNILKSWKSPYFYFAKTGTIGDADNEDDINDKFLLLVISKGDVRELSGTELQKNKFYTLFITGIDLDVQPASERWNLIADVVKATEESYLFKSYMNGEE